MTDELHTRPSREAFLSLASRAGLELSEAELAQLIRRNVLRPRQQPDGGESFHQGHLYMLARYFEAARPTRHPWATVAPALTLQEVNEESRKLHELDVANAAVGARPDADRAGELARSVRAHAERINPFGPLEDVARLLGDEGRAQLRGDGLLYVHLVEFQEWLEGLAGDEGRQTQEIEVSADDEPQAPPSAFDRQDSQVTARSQDLQRRLAQLRSHDKEVARRRGQTPYERAVAVATKTKAPDPRAAAGPAEANAEEVPTKEAHSEAANADESAAVDRVRERIERLNRLRETYIAEQRWAELAGLYEDGIELFVDPVERQQVFLTLAMLYDIKLGRPELAFDKYAAAYLEEGTPKAGRKALECLQRLGREPSRRPRYVAFLEEQLAGDKLDEARRAELRRQLDRLQQRA